MSNTALNRTTAALLTNKSGGALAYGDVVILDNTNANGFTTTTTAGLSTRQIGVVLEPNGIANNATGMVAVGGWVPKINLNTAATVGQFLKTHTVAGQATPHSSPQVEGDFAVALDASATPRALLFGAPNGPGGGSGTVTNTGTLTANRLVLGNGTTDVTVLGSLGTTTQVLHGNAAGAPSFGAIVSADLPTPVVTRSITFVIDGGGAPLTTGVKADVYVPYACTITGVTMLADQSGSCVVDIWKDTYANYPPTVADTITASAKPTLSAAAKSQDTTLTGWTTSIAAGSTLRFNIDSASTITRLSLTLTVTV